ncbi:hypothetical protein [Pseudomonas thivervalensis]|uniref:hypothetical protein n=1 Tax=Pseudomonas thivervalensis TaxID=86265 RepID=UPI003CF1EAAB
MNISNLTDIDSLCLSVRDQESKRLISEAVAAYRGGALRSAIMSTWIALAFDIISKARELAAQGEAASIAFVRDLDSAIANSDIGKLMKVESDLLKTANEQLQILAPHEFVALDRLKYDRNLCAHPAFVVEDELYQPSPESVRSHIVHTLQYLLIHAPLQGKSAILRFDADLMSSSFPSGAADIGTYIRAKYLDRAKEVLVVNLIKSLISAPFGGERDRFVGRTRLLATTLYEIAKAKTAIYESIVPRYVALRVDAVDDADLLGICPFLEADSRIWGWLSEPVRLRIKKLLHAVDVQSLKVSSAFDVFVIPDLGEMLLARFFTFDRITQISIISEHPKREFVSVGISIYRAAGSHKSAEELGRAVVIPLACHFTADDVRLLLDAADGNEQIYWAAGTPSVLEAVFDGTSHLLQESKEYWQRFVNARIAELGDPTARYAYPGLQQRLATEKKIG